MTGPPYAQQIEDLALTLTLLCLPFSHKTKGKGGQKLLGIDIDEISAKIVVEIIIENHDFNLELQKLKTYVRGRCNVELRIRTPPVHSCNSLAIWLVMCNVLHENSTLF